MVALIVHCIRIELEFGRYCFLWRGENRSTRRKTSWSREENQQQTQPTYDAETGNRTQATLVGGECSHHCAIPAPLNMKRSALGYLAALTRFHVIGDHPSGEQKNKQHKQWTLNNRALALNNRGATLSLPLKFRVYRRCDTALCLNCARHYKPA